MLLLDPHDLFGQNVCKNRLFLSCHLKMSTNGGLYGEENRMDENGRILLWWNGGEQARFGKKSQQKYQSWKLQIN